MFLLSYVKVLHTLAKRKAQQRPALTPTTRTMPEGKQIPNQSTKLWSHREKQRREIQIHFGQWTRDLLETSVSICASVWWENEKVTFWEGKQQQLSQLILEHMLSAYAGYTEVTESSFSKRLSSLNFHFSDYIIVHRGFWWHKKCIHRTRPTMGCLSSLLEGEDSYLEPNILQQFCCLTLYSVPQFGNPC